MIQGAGGQQLAGMQPRFKELGCPASDDFFSIGEDVAAPRRVTRSGGTASSCALGGIAGAVGTVPMTAVMAAINRVLPADERLPLPQEPKVITEEVLRRCGLEQELSGSQRRHLSWWAHFAYGAASGAGYAWLQRRSRCRPAVQGPLYGLLLFAAGYCGRLPALQILPRPSQRPAGRYALLIVVHLVWGAAVQIVGPRNGRHPVR